jgi:hypothetical protein
LGGAVPDPAPGRLGLSAVLVPVAFDAIDPRTGKPIRIDNQLAGKSLAAFFAGMVRTFSSSTRWASSSWRSWADSSCMPPKRLLGR